MTLTNGPRSKLPYLQRNWITGLNHHSQGQAMGTTLSNPSITGDKADKFSGLITARDDEHHARPAKRRRFAEGSPDSGLGPDINAFSLPEEPGDMPQALRIEVLKIVHKTANFARFDSVFYGAPSPAVNDIIATRARCKVSITCQQAGEAQVLHCDSQICIMKTFREPLGSAYMSRIYLPHPFTVPKDKLSVEREDDDAFDLADAYGVSIELESGGHSGWPPLNLLSSKADEDVFSGESRPPRYWSFVAHMDNIFQRDSCRTILGLKLKKAPRSEVATNYCMEADVRWSTGFSESAILKKLESSTLPYITVLDPDREASLEANGLGDGHQVNGHSADSNAGGPVDDVEDEAEGEITPSRSLRVRGSKNYNLKLLSDKAQGKERRRRQTLEKSEKATENTIYWRLPSGSYSDVGYACCICLVAHQSLNQLRAHFFSHPQFVFHVDSKGPRGVQITLSHREDGSASPLQSKVYQLGLPLEPLDLDKYVDGDDSWVTSRYGPDNDNDAAQKPAQAKPYQKPVRRKEQKIVIPSTKQPLFDPLSKALLQPGSELREHRADETWLIQKHRDTVQDFFDVDATEKEYMKEWDAFIISRKISSDAYIPRAFSAFVKEKAPWLVASTARIHEFGKHLSVLIARESLDEQTIQEALNRIQEARSQKRQEDKPRESPKEAQYRSSRGCAVCARPVRGPSLLLCADPECKKPLYHDDCIRPLAKMQVDDPAWRCNTCCSK